MEMSHNWKVQKNEWGLWGKSGRTVRLHWCIFFFWKNFPIFSFFPHFLIQALNYSKWSKKNAITKEKTTENFIPNNGVRHWYIVVVDLFSLFVSICRKRWCNWIGYFLWIEFRWRCAIHCSNECNLLFILIGFFRWMFAFEIQFICFLNLYEAD